MTKTFSDEELTAFLDGEADEALSARIAAVQHTDDVIKAQLAALRVDKDALRNAMDHLLDAAPAYTPPEPVRSRWMAVAALAAAVAIGGVLGWTAPKAPQSPTWTEAVASYQALYITETLSGSAGGPDQVAQLDVLGDTLGLSLEGADTLDQIEFKRAQLLGFEGHPLVQIAYLTPDGSPVALCIVSREGGDMPATSGQMMGMASVTWQRDGFGYLLIGTDNQELIDGIAKEAQALL